MSRKTDKAIESNILRLPVCDKATPAPEAGTGRPATTQHGQPDPALHRAAYDDPSHHLFSKDPRNRPQHQEWMAAELEQALLDNRFVLHYQPQYEMGSERIVGVEALVRLTTEDGDLILPDNFVPIAEENGFINRLGHWVIREACRQLALWRASGVGPLRMAVNVSPRQLSDRHLIDIIEDAITEFDLEYNDLELEITEQCMFDYLPLAKNILQELHDRGLRIAVDDFGTGYSSFAYLAELPLNVFKIDRSFLTKITTDGRARQVVSAMIAMARELDFEIVAEGVETEQQYQFLQTTGCNFCQGFGLARPDAAAAIEKRLLITQKVAMASKTY